MKSLYKYVIDILENRVVTFDTPKFNQCVILAGGPGSGKGYATNNNILADFKTLNVDDLKKSYIKLQKAGKLDDEREYDMSIPQDTYALHAAVRDRGWKHKQRNIFWSQREKDSKDRLPNILFDMVTGDPDDIREIVQYAKPLGYEVTIVWVVCNMETAKEGNQHRKRRVPNEILVKGHRSAYQCMIDVLSNKYPDICEAVDNFWIVLSAGFGRDFTKEYSKQVATKVKRFGSNFDSNIINFVDDFLKVQMPTE